MENRLSGSFIVGFDLGKSPDGNIDGVLLVGMMNGKSQKIVNAFQGQEALDIYKKLTTVREKNLAEAFKDERKSK